MLEQKAADTAPPPHSPLSDGNETIQRKDHGVPGTLHLVDIEREKLILIPTPSADPDDPLNWSPRRKALATFCWCIFTFFNTLANANIASVLVPLSEARGLPVSTLNAGTGYLFLLAGWAMLFWQPLALQYGKRFTYIISLMCLVATSMWAPYCTTSGLWYARMIMSGFFASPVEALPELSIADLYFTHERGTYTGLYSAVLIGSNFAAPLICGFINAGQGWRWVFYYPAIFAGAASVFLFFFMEETNFDRSKAPSLSFEPETSMNGSVLKSAASTLPKDTDLVTRQDQSRGKKTYIQKLAPIQVSHPFVFHKRVWRQLYYLSWPVPVYSGFYYGSALIWFNVMNATASTILSGTPYHFPSSLVGLAYVAPLIGTLGAGIYVGYGSDLLSKHLARRNNGIFEPEQRLLLGLVLILIVPASLILWGVGAAHQIHWIGLLFAMAGLGFQNTVGASLGFTYLVDSHRELSGDAMTAVILVRNTMGFAINYGISPWLEHLGLVDCFVSAAMIGLACAATIVLAIWKGKAWRTWRAETYWRLVETQGQH